MKIMGLNNWLHWLAWFVKSLLMLCIPIVAITIVLSMYLNTSSSVFLIFLLVYITATINFCFAVSVVFDKGGRVFDTGGRVFDKGGRGIPHPS